MVVIFCWLNIKKNTQSFCLNLKVKGDMHTKP